jgi:hypothetical protein
LQGVKQGSDLDRMINGETSWVILINYQK